MNCNEEYKLLQSDKESRLNNPTPTRGKASSDYLDAEYTTCMSSEPSLDDHGTNEQLPSKNYGRPRTYRMTMNREPNEHLCHTTASNIAHVVSGTLGSSAPPPILPTFYWSKLRRSRGRSIQKSHNYKKLGVGTRTNFAHSTKLFQQNALRAGVPSGEKIMFKDSDTKPLDNEKKEIPVNGKRMRSNELGISMINVNMPPGEVDIYFFDHGTSGYYSTTDIAPILLSHKCVDKIDNAATRFWAEIFGTIHIGMTFVTAFILQLLRFILRSILRPLIVGIIQMIADYAFKPILTIIFNGIIQPIFIFLYNITTSFRDVCEPIAKAIGYFFREFANLFRAIRLIEINPQSATDNNYHHRIIAPT